MSFDIEFSYTERTDKVTVLARTPLGKKVMENVCGPNGYRKFGSSPTYYGKMEKIADLRKALKRAGLSVGITPLFKKAVDTQTHLMDTIKAEAMKRFAEAPLPGFQLRPYQAEDAIKMSLSKTLLNASSMGTGKTMCAIMALPWDCRVIIMCPKSMKSTWVEELARWRPDLTTFIPKQGKDFRLPVPREVVITTFSSLPIIDKEIDAEYLKKHPDPLRLDPILRQITSDLVIIADEFHQAANLKAARTVRTRALTWATIKAGGRCYGLTGTPLLTRPPQLWCLMMNLKLCDETFGTWDNFCRVMGGRQGDYGMEWTGNIRTEVADLIAPVMIRRQLEEVWEEMPEKTFSEIPIDLKDKNLLKFLNEMAEHMGDLRGLNGDQVMERMDLLAQTNPSLIEEYAVIRRELADAKFLALGETIEAYEEAEEAVVVMCDHVDPIKALGARPGWACIHGGVSEKARDKARLDFQAGKLKGLAVTIPAGGVGLTLTHARHMLFIDQNVTPEINKQAQARIMRIGQKNACVYKIATLDHPLERRLDEIRSGKEDMVTRTIDAASKSSKIGHTRQDRLASVIEGMSSKKSDKEIEAELNNLLHIPKAMTEIIPEPVKPRRPLLSNRLGSLRLSDLPVDLRDALDGNLDEEGLQDLRRGIKGWLIRWLGPDLSSDNLKACYERLGVRNLFS